nr:nicotinamide-nucleotide amidohydrolase family protein [Ornithinimicrobium sp. F0845]
MDAPDAARVDPRAARAVEELRRAGASIATAESLTGGLVCAALTSVPGASSVVFGGIASYSSDLKIRVLGVPADVIAEHGTVAEQTALHMADGARRVAGADVGVATTGVAGPDPTEGKPVGEVFVAVTRESVRLVRVFTFHGSREQVRRQAVESALELVIEALSGPE